MQSPHGFRLEFSNAMASTMLHVEAISDHQADYIRRAFQIIGVADYGT
jgi:hypothetical protein